jgi:hypothetical protein
MTQRRIPFDTRVPGWILTVVLTVAIGLALAAGASRRNERGADSWRSMVETGDELAAGRRTATLDGKPLTARKAYLLAFHLALDAGDVEHVLAVADRLDWLGDLDLAARARRAAGSLVEEIGR